jgi:hypothetical protein
MRKQILLGLITILITTGTLQAQNFKFSPLRVYNDTIPLNGIFNRNIDIINTSVNPIQLGWERIQKDMPDAWDYSMCDDGDCLVGIPQSGTTAIIKKGEKGFLKFLVDPQGTTKKGFVQIFVHEVGSASGDTITCYFVSSSSSKVSGIDVQSGAATSVRLSPNPAAESMSIISTLFFSNVLIMDYLGRQVNECKITAFNNNISLKGLQPGLYFIRLVTRDNIIINKPFYKL